MSRRIAPTLTRLTRFPLQKGAWLPPGTTVGDCIAAEKELRALLRVASAARAWVAAPDLHSTVEPANAMVKALAALDRASGGK
jgi:hypothetical protein